jgi:hypothetical protein
MKPTLTEELIKLNFGECRYSCELTNEPSYFYTILVDDFSIFIEEWILSNETEIEIHSTVFGKEKKLISLPSGSLNYVLNEIKKVINKE